MKTPSVRSFVRVLPLTALVVVALGADAHAASLSSPSGMKTISNTPELSWTTAENEIADQVRVSKSPAVDATGRLKSRYTSLAEDEITTVGITGGSTSEWADSTAAPLWPGTYFWQVQTTTTQPDGAQVKAWSTVHKLVIPFAINGVIEGNDALLKPSGDVATMTQVIKIRTNAKSVPANLTFRLNGNVYATLHKPFTRIDDIRQLVATVPVRMVIRRSYLHRGANVDTISGSIGSKATTGRAYPVKSTRRFTIK